MMAQNNGPGFGMVSIILAGHFEQKIMEKETMICDASVEAFVEALASKSATPGGGSVTAIMGAMGAALVSMVCNLTIGKKNYESVGEEMQDLLQRSGRLQQRFLDLVRADVEAFDAVMACYGLPKDSDEDKLKRSEAIQVALKDATRVPLECAAACVEVVELAEIAAYKGNKNVLSDAGVAVAAAKAALDSARLNVEVNLGAIRDGMFVAESRTQLEKMTFGTADKAAHIYRQVLEGL